MSGVAKCFNSLNPFGDSEQGDEEEDDDTHFGTEMKSSEQRRKTITPVRFTFYIYIFSLNDKNNI